MTAPFGARLSEVAGRRGTLCAGIDPHPALLEAWGLPVDARGVEEFSLRALEAFGDLAAAVKPQVALFEEHGSAGLAVLERVLARIDAAGALSIADAKRGDIGSTMAAYARAWLGDASPLACDALTVSPYLGVGSLDPAFDLAASTGRGLLVLARTSNPEGATVQRARLAGAGDTGRAEDGSGDSRSVAQAIVDEIGARNREAGAGAGGCGPFGVVVGATVADPPDLSALDGPVLMPGVGEQGGTADDVRRIAGPAIDVTLVNVSRQVLRAGPDPAAMRSVAWDLIELHRVR